jgi:hypothetical protein
MRSLQLSQSKEVLLVQLYELELAMQLEEGLLVQQQEPEQVLAVPVLPNHWRELQQAHQ